MLMNAEQIKFPQETAKLHVNLFCHYDSGETS
jgi:hypothetical protein